jgi:hypothetical protein
MPTISLSFFVVMLVSSLYYFMLGLIIVLKKRKILDVFTILAIEVIKISKGHEEADQYKSRIMNTRNFIFYGVYYIIGSGFLLAIALFVL